MRKVKLAIIGSGPAGYTAAIYSSRAQIETVVFTGLETGGQLMYTRDLENFPGFPEGIIGPKFMMGMQEQASRFGAEIIHQHVTAVDFSARPFKLWTKFPEGVEPEDFKSLKADQLLTMMAEIRKLEADFEAESVIVSTGANSIMLGVPGEKNFLGNGVSVCAVCDAAFYKDKKTFVIGGGDSAMEDALALTKFTDDVTVVHRRDSFRASKIMQERVLNHPSIKVIWNASLEEIIGDKKIEKIKLNVNGKSEEHPADGVFLAIGHRPATNIFQDQLALDDHGFLITRSHLSVKALEMAAADLEKGSLKFSTMTSVEGVFGAGDVTDVRYQQAIVAAGSGAKAALDAEDWLELEAAKAAANK
jgi:thioredoxin reductase (NADPH)